MKPIFLDQKTKEELIKNFTEHLEKIKLSSNTLTYSTNITKENINVAKAKLVIHPTAYLKMMLYVRDTSTEIAWHGTVFKPDDNTYFIEDVFLYPQKLSAATVTTDQKNYNDWCIEVDDNTYNNMRLQGHSHVNFGVTPSGTDTTFYNSILQVLSKNDFYVFMIMNKAGDMFFLIYDLKNNIIYEKQDILVEIRDYNETEDILRLIDTEKEVFCEKPVIPAYNQTNISPYTNPYHHPQTTNPWSTSIGYAYEEDETDIDRIFTELDNKFKNAKLDAPKSKKGKKNNESY